MRDSEAVSESRSGGKPAAPKRNSITVPPVPPVRPMTPRPAAVASAGVAPQKAEIVLSGKPVDDHPPESSAPTPRYLPPFDAAARPAFSSSPTKARPIQHTSLGVGEPLAVKPGGAESGVPPSEPSAVVPKISNRPPGLDSSMRAEISAMVQAALQEAMAPFAARERELAAKSQDELAVLVRTAVDNAIASLAVRERELAERLERAERAIAATSAEVTAAVSNLAASSNVPPSIPVSTAPSIAPARLMPDVPKAPRAASLPPHVSAASRAHSSDASRPPRGRANLPVEGERARSSDATRQAYALQVAEGASSADIDISAFDGQRRTRMVSRVVMVILLLIMAGVITMTLLSYSPSH